MAWAVCPYCKKERRLTGTGKLSRHKKWDENKKEMTECIGTFQRPPKWNEA